jgi:argininosuccinate synthase
LSDRVVLGFSGGLDTSVAVLWLKEEYGLDVITVTVDVGQNEDLRAVERRSRELGAIRHYNIDAKDEFVRGYVHKAIKANALYEGEYPLGTALARPLIAKKLVDIAHKEGAIAVSHGCTGKGNDQVRFEVTIKALDPTLRIIAPMREWNLTRDKEVEYAMKRGFYFEASKSQFSVDQNIWGRSIEGGILEDPSKEPPEEAFEWTVAATNAPNEPGYMTLTFEGGVPVRVNGEELQPVELITFVNRFAGQHGVGRIDHIEDRLVGIKSREVYEYPAALTIIEAHRDLEKMVLTRHQLFFKRRVEEEWAWLVYSGLWVDPLREDLDAFIDSTQRYVEGEVTIKLYKGSYRVVSRKSRYSLYSHDLATYTKDSTFQQSSATGFIELWGLPSRLAYRNKPFQAEKVEAARRRV